MKRLLLTKLLLVVTLAASGQGTLKEFIEKNIYVIDVEQKLDIVTAHGYSEGSTSIEEFKIKLKRNQVFAIWNRAGHPLISLVTIPFKVRPGIGTAPQIVTTGLSNAGISLSLYNKKLDRYFSGGKKSSHTFGVGVILSPTGEDLKSSNTNGVVIADIKQLFISAAIGFTYSYNDLTFAFIPMGWEVATTTEGKNWIYNKERWWGFGIGINTKILGNF